MTGTEYVNPADRPAEWARMARALEAAGRSYRQIAEALWIDEPTVAALLDAR